MSSSLPNTAAITAVYLKTMNRQLIDQLAIRWSAVLALVFHGRDRRAPVKIVNELSLPTVCYPYSVRCGNVNAMPYDCVFQGEKYIMFVTEGSSGSTAVVPR